jgi:hypothetical protein
LPTLGISQALQSRWRVESLILIDESGPAFVRVYPIMRADGQYCLQRIGKYNIRWILQM